MRLLGAKEFLKIAKPGTLFLEFWLEDEDECLKLIADYKEQLAQGNSPVNYLRAHYCNDFYIFGDNHASLSFLYDETYNDTAVIDGKEYNCLFYVDKNIVGDADPFSTLNLVFDSEDEWPDAVVVERSHFSASCEFLSKIDIKKIRDYFVTNMGPFVDELSEEAWALKELETNESYKDDYIVNYK